MADQPEQPTVKDELKALSDKLDALSGKLDAHSKRDVWDKFQIISGFVSSIILATLGFYFTYHFNENEAAKDAAAQKFQQRSTELQAIISLTPQLSSSDTGVKHHAELTLKALSETKSAYKDSPGGGSSSVLNQYISLVQSSKAPDSVRSNAVRDIADIAKNGSDPAIREKAKQVVSSFAVSPTLPAETRKSSQCRTEEPAQRRA